MLCVSQGDRLLYQSDALLVPRDVCWQSSHSESNVERLFGSRHPECCPAALLTLRGHTLDLENTLCLDLRQAQHAGVARWLARHVCAGRGHSIWQLCAERLLRAGSL